MSAFPGVDQMRETVFRNNICRADDDDRRLKINLNAINILGKLTNFHNSGNALVAGVVSGISGVAVWHFSASSGHLAHAAEAGRMF